MSAAFDVSQNSREIGRRMFEWFYRKHLIPLAKNLERDPRCGNTLLNAPHGCAVLAHRLSHLLGRLDSELGTTLHRRRITHKIERMAGVYLV